MFGIGPMEMIVIAIVAMVFIGPERLPDVMRKFGRMFVQIRRQANDVKSSFNEVIHDAEREFELERIRELQHKLSSTSPSQILDAAIKPTPTPYHEGPGFDEEGHPRPGFDENGKPLAQTDTHALDYHDSHYVDGKFTDTHDGFIPWDPSMNRPLSELFPLAPEAAATPPSSAETPNSATTATETKNPEKPDSKTPKT